VLFSVLPIKNAESKVRVIAELFTAFAAQVLSLKESTQDIYGKTMVMAVESCLAPVEDLKSLANCMLSHIDTIQEQLLEKSEKEIIKEFKSLTKYNKQKQTDAQI
jgi:hypothetical protein